MSLLPLFFDYNPWSSIRPRYNDWDIFGLEIAPREFQRMFRAPRWGNALRKTDTELPTPTIGKDGFQACIDVQQFQPNEITVKTVDNNIIIEGKHEEREDEHGFISRHFVRKYALPAGYDPKEVVSTLSSDGVLTIKAPPPPSKELKSNERIVQIQQTGPAHLNVKENVAEDEQEKDKEKTKEKEMDK